MGKRGPAPCHVYGAAAISHALYGVDFPKTKQELIEKHGDREIEFTKKEAFKLSEILERLPDKLFNSPSEIEQALYKKSKLE